MVPVVCWRTEADLDRHTELFRRDAISYVNAYDFLSQLVDYDDPDLERLHAFLKMLLPRLRGQDPDPMLIDGAVRLARYKLVNKRAHDLSLENLRFFAERIPNLLEVSIGHAITADALIYGLAETVRRYKAACA